MHLPSPRRRGSGLPSPVLKLAWQRRQTYIFELDIIGLMPGSDDGRAAEYSAWVCRNLTLSVVVAAGAAVELAVVLDRCVAMARELTSHVEPAARDASLPTKTLIVLALKVSCLYGVIFVGFAGAATSE